VFLVGVLWSGANSKGAMAALLIGGSIGASRLLLEMNKASLSGSLLYFVNINYLHFALLLFALSVLILTVVSILAKSPPKQDVSQLVLWNRGSYGHVLDSRRTNTILSVGVLGVIAVIWMYFR